MIFQNQIKQLLAISVLLSSASMVSADLYDRGGGLIYDDVLNITWLQDANYAYTSGYAAANENHSPSGTTEWDVFPDGKMGRSAMQVWVDQLIYQGYSDWRLPSVNGTYPTTGYNIDDSDMGHMYYNNLGLINGQGISNNSGFTDATTGQIKYFINDNDYYWWYDEDFSGAWTFWLGYDGYQGISPNYERRWGWAVRDGDVDSSYDPDGDGVPTLSPDNCVLICI